MNLLCHLLTPDDDTVELWGHRFRWTPEHPAEEDLVHLLHSYDKLATEALDRLDELAPPTTKGWKCPHGDGPGARDLYALLRKHAHEDETLGRLWEEVSTVPEWVDWDQIERGQRVIFRYNGQILLGLLFKSLLGGMGAWRVVETLGRTGGFGVAVTRRRLLETLQHFVACATSLASVQPGGDGFAASVRVRLLHASVRRRITQLERARPGYFDTAALGVPINDLHCIGTVSVYSAAVVFMALPRQGVLLGARETEDYLALWRWVGHLLGAPVGWLATPASAKAMMESVMAMELRPSPTSRVLAGNVLTAQTNVPPLYARREYLAALAYRLNGDELAGGLGIERPAIQWRLLVWVQCFVLLLSSTVYAWLPERAQRRRDKNVLGLCNDMILSHKMGGIGKPSQFEFQYIPNLDKATEPTELMKAAASMPAGSPSSQRPWSWAPAGRVLRAAGLIAVVYAGAWSLRRYGLEGAVSVATWLPVCS